MKKVILVLVLLSGLAFGAFCQASGPIDLVVLLDTSAGMSSHYRETSDYLTGPFLREFLRLGDTFHLISFSGSPKLEISRRIEGIGDIETIVARMLLMYPLDPQSNLGNALSFAENYTSSLTGTRPGKLVLLADGSSQDAQNLASAAQDRLRGQGTDFQYIQVPISGTGPLSGRPALAARPPMTPSVPAPTQPTIAQPAPVQPAPAQPATTQPVPTQTVPVQPAPTQPATAQPTTTQPTPAQPVPVQPAPAQPTPAQPTPAQPTPAQPAPTQPVPAQPTPAQPSTTQPTPAQTAPTQPATAQPAITQPTPAQPVTAQPSTTQPTPVQPTPTQPATTQPTPAQPVPAQPAAGQQTSGIASTGVQSPAAQTQQRSRPSASATMWGLPLPLLIVLGILGLLALGLIIFLAARRLRDSSGRAMPRATTIDRKHAELMSNYAQTQKSQAMAPLEHRPSDRKPLPKDKIYDESAYANGGPAMLNLFVEDQNTNIGRRNIHTAKVGNFTLGGGNSDFLIFIVPFPPSIANVQFDGRNCTLLPLKPKYFPDIGSQSVPNCIGKNIRVISDRNYELYFRLERYEDPLKVLNKLLNSISVPGGPGLAKKNIPGSPKNDPRKTQDPRKTVS